MEFVINRKTWRCGQNGDFSHGEGDTYLLNEQGYMCCLGQMCLQLGVKATNLINTGAPCDIHISSKKLPTLLVNKHINNTLFAQEAMHINDSTFINDQERERKLSALASRWKHKITFKGKFSKKVVS
jgi:hypothetical protein